MKKNVYNLIHEYMLCKLSDTAHDSLHIYRVLNQALFLARQYADVVDRDVLIASALLHDIGRAAQFQNPHLCHAMIGGEMAYDFLKSLDWEEAACVHVQQCITTHRFRADREPDSIEAKILFDADKLDVTGAIGIARTLIYKGCVNEPLYVLNDHYRVNMGKNREDPESFLKEYYFKLIKVYDGFYTKEASSIASKRKKYLESFFAELLEEISISHFFNPVIGDEEDV